MFVIYIDFKPVAATSTLAQAEIHARAFAGDVRIIFERK